MGTGRIGRPANEKRHREKHKSLSLCINCSNKSIEGMVRCERCREKNKQGLIKFKKRQSSLNLNNTSEVEK